MKSRPTTRRLSGLRATSNPLSKNTSTIRCGARSWSLPGACVESRLAVFTPTWHISSLRSSFCCFLGCGDDATAAAAGDFAADQRSDQDAEGAHAEPPRPRSFAVLPGLV